MSGVLFLRTVFGLLFLGVGLFGAANWHCSLVPEAPKISCDATDDVRKQKLQEWEAEKTSRAAQVSIPFTLALPLTFVGLLGFVILVPKPDMD